MTEKTEPERFPCPGCKFSYVLVKADRKDAEPTVIRNHNSRTGPGRCEGSGKAPGLAPFSSGTADPSVPLETGTLNISQHGEDLTAAYSPQELACGHDASLDRCEDCGQCSGGNDCLCPCNELPGEQLAHVHQWEDMDDQDGHHGTFCVCGAEETTDGRTALESLAAAVPYPTPERVANHCVVGGCRGCCGCSSECTDSPCGDGELSQPVVVSREETMAALEYVFTAPAPVVETVPVVSDGEADGRGDLVPDTALPVPVVDEFTTPTPTAPHCFPGACTGGCGSPSWECPSARQTAISPSEEPAVDEFTTPAPVADSFTAPAPMPAEMPAVHGQPEPDRDRWGRYMIMGSPHTRVTTFVKSASSTFSLNQWQQRMVIAGLVQRRDLLALAHGLDVKRDRNTLNSIAEQAKEAAGQKVAANLGTAYHAFSERLDAGMITLQDIPPEYRARMEQYSDTVRRSGLVTRPEWIERSTAVRADQVSAGLPVAGTLDRIFQLPNGELVIGDLKTGADLSYGWGEIAAQLAIYAHGVNTHGLFDWNTKTWEGVGSGGPSAGHIMPAVRTDFAIVIHLPAGGDGCTLYRVDIAKGWERAQVCGQVMTMQKSKDSMAHPITVLEMNPSGAQAPPVEVQRPKGPNPVLSGGAVDQLRALPAAPKQSAFVDTGDPYALALHLISQAPTRERIAELYQFAVDSGKFTEHGLADMVTAGMARVAELG